MSVALEFFYYIYDKFIETLFSLQIVSGVYLGWVLISILLIYILICTLFSTRKE